MLTPALSGARPRKDELLLPRIDKAKAAQLEAISAMLFEVYVEHRGSTRGDLLEALDALQVPAKDRKLMMGLRKLLDDRAVFEVATDLDVANLRMNVWRAAAAARRQLVGADRFDRERVLAQVASEHQTEVTDVDNGLFADLKEAQKLLDVGIASASELVGAYRVGQVQAVLLRATRVVVVLASQDPLAVRRLFARLKLLQLLFVIDEDNAPASGHAEGGPRYRLVLDGPMALFGQSTRYGVKLASLVPLLVGFSACRIEADVLWGKARNPLKFVWQAEGGSSEPWVTTTDIVRAELVELADAFADRTEGWRVATSSVILHLPGVGLCAPDLEFTHLETGFTAHLELLGFWSRAAVWERVSLVEHGIRTPLIFAVSSRLRVSAQALGENASAALLVFKGTLRPKAVLERLEKLRRSSAPHTSRTPAGNI